MMQKILKAEATIQLLLNFVRGGLGFTQSVTITLSKLCLEAFQASYLQPASTRASCEVNAVNADAAVQVLKYCLS